MKKIYTGTLYFVVVLITASLFYRFYLLVAEIISQGDFIYYWQSLLIYSSWMLSIPVGLILFLKYTSSLRKIYRNFSILILLLGFVSLGFVVYDVVRVNDIHNQQRTKILENIEVDVYAPLIIPEGYTLHKLKPSSDGIGLDRQSVVTTIADKNVLGLNDDIEFYQYNRNHPSKFQLDKYLSENEQYINKEGRTDRENLLALSLPTSDLKPPTNCISAIPDNDYVFTSPTPITNTSKCMLYKKTTSGIDIFRQEIHFIEEFVDINNVGHTQFYGARNYFFIIDDILITFVIPSILSIGVEEPLDDSMLKIINSFSKLSRDELYDRVDWLRFGILENTPIWRYILFGS